MKSAAWCPAARFLSGSCVIPQATLGGRLSANICRSPSASPLINSAFFIAGQQTVRALGHGAIDRSPSRRRRLKRRSLEPRISGAGDSCGTAGDEGLLAGGDVVRFSVDLVGAFRGGEQKIGEEIRRQHKIGVGEVEEGGRREMVHEALGGKYKEEEEELRGPGRPPLSLPFASAYHVPVVCKEVLEWLVTDPDGIYVDCTLGGGGHSAALLEEALGERGRVVGLDRDSDALREASRRLSREAERGRFQAIRSNFADVGKAVRGCQLLRARTQEPAAAAAAAANDDVSRESGHDSAEGLNEDNNVTTRGMVSRIRDGGRGGGGGGEVSPLVDGILVDLGVSSHQINERNRGFSFSSDGPLDMRMEGASSRMEGDPAVDGADFGRRNAADVVNFADEVDVREMVWRYGEEKRSTKIARAIVESRPITTTGHLAEVVGRCAPPKDRTKTLARVFQALRIEVNGELNALETLLEEAKYLVKPGGRLVMLSYHSLEDRRVKRVLSTGNLKGRVVKDFYGNTLSPWKPLLRKPLVAGEEEVALNPRARSVRLRVAERTSHR